MKYERICPICGKRFAATRRDALCCSGACRKQKTRLARLENDEQRIVEELRMSLPKPQKPKPATVDNIAETLMDIKGSTTALRFYARSCPVSIRPRLMILADCIDEAMKGVGF